MSVVSTTGFIYYWVMIENAIFHLGYVMAQSVTHQASNSHVRVLHAS